MGCGASAPASPDKEAAESPVCDTEAPSTTWATKTSPDGGLGSDTSHFMPPSKAIQGGSSLQQSRRDENVILLDAEDSDGIEFIQETEQKQPARHRQPSAANGQEPPEAAESEMLRQPLVEQKPLSKQQQEEAAKLAERRKRFDNQRYQREQRSADASPFDMPGAVNPGPVRKEPTNGYPTNTDMMLGLNVTDVARKEVDTLQGGCLPGGIWDDDEILQTPQKSSCRHEQHDEVRSTGFDDADEMLMKEILDGFDD